MKRFIAVLACIALCACQTTKNAEQKVGSWFTGHKSQFAQTGQTLAADVASIAEQTVYQGAISAADALLKQQNVQGFSDSLHALETGAIANSTASIPNLVMQLRNIWLGPQQHYTDFAQQLGTALQNAANGAAQNGKLTQDQLNAIVETAIQGLQASAPRALKGA